MTIFNRTIIQFSPLRSGSTLIAAILREIFPRYVVRKVHNIGTFSRRTHIFILNNPVVSTCRHPLDVIRSELKLHDRNPHLIEIEKACQHVESRGLLTLREIKNRQNVLLLKYENFYGNNDFIYDSLEHFFSIDISTDTRSKLNNKFSIDTVKRLTSAMNANEFTDKSTHFHGKHISDTNGRPGAYRSFFDSQQIEWLEHRYKDFLSEFEYHT